MDLRIYRHASLEKTLFCLYLTFKEGLNSLIDRA